MLTTHQAATLMTLIECATDGNWPGTVAGLEERGYPPYDVVDAWQKLEQMAGMSGTVPEEGDF